MTRRRIHWGAKTPGKKKPTPKRAVQEARNLANARKAREADPHIAALYDAFAPPAGSRKKARI